jgi:hypothetical protein
MDNPEKLTTLGTQDTRRRQTKQNNKNHITVFVGHHYTHKNTNNVNKTWAILQTTGGKDEHNIDIMSPFFCSTDCWKKETTVLIYSGCLVLYLIIYCHT